MKVISGSFVHIIVSGGIRGKNRLAFPACFPIHSGRSTGRHGVSLTGSRMRRKTI